ncbi:MAG TPA: NAD-dependent epimerase/dehydratase family protein [Drouetiella sp.]
MHILIIGGTVFLGRHLVLQALAAGHKVTTLNRGSHNLPEQLDVEKLIDDRTKDLDSLSGKKFDAVIDTCGYDEPTVAHSVDILKDKVDSYVFISTISVYCDFLKAGLSENDPIQYSGDTASAEHGRAYGQKKSDCEKMLLAKLGEKALIVRPGIICGSYDPTDRFTYWVERIEKGGKVIAPGQPSRAVQFIDVRDLTRWIIELVERKAHGVYNATGPRSRLSFGDFLAECIRTTGSDAEITWVSDQFLLDEKIQPFVDLPFWLPENLKEYEHLMEINCDKAYADGLKISPLAETIKTTATWNKERPVKKRAAGLDPEMEQSLLSKLKP